MPFTGIHQDVPSALLSGLVTLSISPSGNTACPKPYIYKKTRLISSMNNPAAWAALCGTTVREKLESLGIGTGRTLDILVLDEIARRYGIDIFLFFEKDLAYSHTIEQIMEMFRDVPEYERPYISIDAFLRFTKENDPSFAQTMREFPLMVEIVSDGEYHPGNGGKTGPFVTGLMPFLDELDVNGEFPE